MNEISSGLYLTYEELKHEYGMTMFCGRQVYILPMRN